ncbi:TRAP transporter small permease [Uliginosibacterium sp. H3]|uniref:TRAP transporter small permease protein n=1 Tax=Uliginosibacterium silvisoli TaxID=3114758 RepID=A0ABU6JZN7_9RHOO|nr:TRAP transporter small permease [Uliginosibacterium sp. H3]
MKFLDHLEEWLIATLMGLATTVVFLAVVHRYLSGFAIPYLQDWLLSMDVSWSQEVTIIMFVWMAKFGAAYGVRTGIHVGVDVLINRMQPQLRAKFVLFGLAAGAFFTGLVAILGAQLCWHSGMEHFVYTLLGMPTDAFGGSTKPDTGWPVWAVYLAIPLGSSLMCFRFIQVAVNFLHTGELPRHDHGHVDGLDEDVGAQK